MNSDSCTSSYAYNKANQLVTSTVNGKTTHYKYDAAGRMIQAGDKKYIYNGQNKVAEVRENGKVIAEFEYTVEGQVSTATYGDKTEEFMWDGLALIKRNDISYLNEPYVTGSFLSFYANVYNEAIAAAINIGLFSNNTLEYINAFCNAVQHNGDYLTEYTTLMNKLRNAGFWE